MERARGKTARERRTRQLLVRIRARVYTVTGGPMIEHHEPSANIFVYIIKKFLSALDRVAHK